MFTQGKTGAGMKKTLGLAVMLFMAQAGAQTVETEMATLKQLAENCSTSLSAENCSVTGACKAFKRYSSSLMPDGPAAYYDARIRQQSMHLENGKMVSKAVEAFNTANKATARCNPA